MAKLLSEIQTGVRHNARDNNLTLTSGIGLETVNRMYRRIAAALPWPELRRQDTSITTTAGTETYTWPATPIFLDIKSVEIQDGDDNDTYKAIYKPQDEHSWVELLTLPRQSVPTAYQRSSTSTAHQVSFRPLPKYSTKTIRITGIIEPTSLITADERTIFIQRAADDALEHLIAAEWAMHDGIIELVQIQLGQLQEILKMLFGKEQVPAELFTIPIGTR